VVDYALELEASRPKVDEESNLKIVGFKVVDRLREMHIFQLNYRLKLDQQDTTDQKVDPAGTDGFSAVEDFHLDFADMFDSLAGHFDGEGALVDHFLKPVTKGSMHLHSASDNPSGQFLMQRLLAHEPLIGRHGNL
jgi:hypothetical protein